VSFVVPKGTVLGLLGPNGAGKTTTVRMMTTLTEPTSGTARVAGYDVREQPDMVRRSMGLTGQVATVDELLTGRENIRMIGGLYGIRRRELASLSDQLLEQFSIADAGDRPVKSYSGGMRRRLDLAVSLLAGPPVLFLDEPTTGLDPRSRNELWDVLRGLVADGTTLLLTTQYLEEADRLADHIVVIDHGLVIAAGTSEQLKDQVGGDVVEFVVPDRSRLADASAAVCGLTDGDCAVDPATGRVSLHVGARGSQSLVQAVRNLDAAGVQTDGLALRRPSLDEVFLALTGHAAEDGPTTAQDSAGAGVAER
jgi:ABC-2 type transport system ATP-binding protein